MKTLDDYLNQLASSAPTPGGGSAACLVAAQGAALVAMVARICIESKAFAPWRDWFAERVESADRLRAALSEARIRDEEAYGAVVAAMALPKGTPEQARERSDRLQAALAHAATEPLRAAEIAMRTLDEARLLLEHPNPHLLSDVGCAGEFAAAGIAAAAYNVRVNHRYLRDELLVARQRAALERLELRARDGIVALRAEIVERSR
ncbi:MAG: cyclodeaminase/cyclohydrolase family protein [Candidatus Eremiobacteraeota bacterium]|nr:cyclodeaminase/cyclohydrolase family protein [Candidatus Eremiobacteraeota bacterium]NNM92089.1 cyclodeaminase/cyclohydrolase family protein [Candidatus Eremiobacteraeota bacterium]